MPYLHFNSRNRDSQFDMDDRGGPTTGIHNSLPGALATGNIPMKVWGTKESVLEQAGAIEQALNLANHPLAEAFIALMPDFHPGYGMPIGGVAALKGGVIPNAVGNDIGCGMMAARTEIYAAELTTDNLKDIRLAIHRRVPVGNSLHIDLQSDELYDETSKDVFREGTNGLSPYPVIFENWDRTRKQLGTLGGGNHFMEFQVNPADGKLWVMLHSGSRGVGEKIKTFYDNKAKELNTLWRSGGYTKELAFLPTGTEWYHLYMREMEWAMRWATANRHRMLREIDEAVRDVMGFGLQFEETIETHHNYAAMENWFGENFLVHRKGAVRAIGNVIIPGSMGTASYIARGLNNQFSFGSCSHGAGRLRSRTATNKLYDLERAKAEMAHVVYGVKEGQFDEMPGAYKDIHAVMEQQADLVEPLHRLAPIMVVKG